MRNWRYSDEAYLLFNWKAKTAKQCRNFVTKSEKQIHHYTRKMGWIKIPNWTQFETNLLILFGAKQTSELTGKSFNACKIKLSRIRASLLNNS